MFFHPLFLFDELYFEVKRGECLTEGWIWDEYYGHFNVPEGGRGLCYAVTGIYLL